jgi:hypothetical protein
MSLSYSLRTSWHSAQQSSLPTLSCDDSFVRFEQQTFLRFHPPGPKRCNFHRGTTFSTPLPFESRLVPLKSNRASCGYAFRACRTFQDPTTD